MRAISTNKQQVSLDDLTGDKGKRKTNLSIFHVLVTVLISSISSLLLLTPHLPLADVRDQLLVLLRHVLVNLVDTELPDETFEDVSDLDLEVVRVLVRPVDEGGDESRERGLDERGGEGDDGDLDVSYGGSNDFSVRRREEHDEGGEELGEGLVGDRGCAVD